jgi:hypothetical protein
MDVLGPVVERWFARCHLPATQGGTKRMPPHKQKVDGIHEKSPIVSDRLIYMASWLVTVEKTFFSSFSAADALRSFILQFGASLVMVKS